jgi:hypothetical protein
LCRRVMLDSLLCSFTSISFLTNIKLSFHSRNSIINNMLKTCLGFRFREVFHIIFRWTGTCIRLWETSHF